MTVTLSGRPVRRQEDLSATTQLILSLIPSGAAWLEWAISPGARRFDYVDESGLIADLQSGLHGVGQIVLPGLGLAVSPLKLIQISAADLKVLIAAEQTGSEPDLAKARKVLTKAGLLTLADYWTGRALLSELGVGDASVFQFMDSQGQAAILGLVETVRRAGRTIAREAALFALGKACSAVEFADHVEIYVGLVVRAGQTASTSEARIALVEDALATLRPWLFERLEGPLIVGPKDQVTVALALRNWILSGRTLGFGRLSLGAREIVAFQAQANAATIVEAGRALTKAVAVLLDTVQLRGGVVEQDGAMRFRLQDDRYVAEVRLDADGALTLDRIRAKA